MANKLAVNIGIQPGVFSEGTAEESVDFGGKNGSVKRADYSGDSPGASWEEYTKILPQIFRREGGIDVYAMATRAQRIYDAQLNAQIKAIQSAATEEELEKKLAAVAGGNFDSNVNNKTIREYTENYRESSLAKAKEQDAAAAAASGDDTTFKSDDSSFTDYIQAELRDGSNWVAFRLDEVGSIGESFNNSTKEPGIAATINGISSQAKDFGTNTMNCFC